MSHFFIFVFVSITLGNGSNKILLCFMLKSVLPMFSSKSFKVSNLIAVSLSLEFIFVYDIRVCSNFIDLHAAIPAFPTPLAEETISSPLYILSSSA